MSRETRDREDKELLAKHVADIVKELKEKGIVTVRFLIARFGLEKLIADRVLRHFYSQCEKKTQGIFVITVSNMNKLITAVVTSEELESVTNKVVGLYLVAVRLYLTTEVKYGEVSLDPPKLPDIVYTNNNQKNRQTTSVSAEKEGKENREKSEGKSDGENAKKEAKGAESDCEDEKKKQREPKPSTSTAGGKSKKKRPPSKKKSSEASAKKAEQQKEFKPPLMEGFMKSGSSNPPPDKPMVKTKLNDEKVENFEYDEGGHNEFIKPIPCVKPQPNQTNKINPFVVTGGGFAAPIKNASITSFFKKVQ